MTRRGPDRRARVLRRRSPRPRRAAALRQQAREVFRDAILEAAERVFARSGIAGTRMAEVAAEAGLATGTLYNYFTGREELLGSLIERRSEERIAAVTAAVEGARGGIRARLVALLTATFEHTHRHRAFFAVLPAAGGISGRHVAAIARQYFESQRRYSEVVAAAVSGAVADGSLRGDVPEELLVSTFTGAAQGVMRAWMAQDPEVKPLVDQAPAVVDLFLRGANPRS